VGTGGIDPSATAGIDLADHASATRGEHTVNEHPGLAGIETEVTVDTHGDLSGSGEREQVAGDRGFVVRRAGSLKACSDPAGVTVDHGPITGGVAVGDLFPRPQRELVRRHEEEVLRLAEAVRDALRTGGAGPLAETPREHRCDGAGE